MCMFMWTVHFPFQFRLFICDMNSFMIGSPKKTPYLNKNRITREFINEINQRLVILDVSLSTFGYLALSSLTSGKSVHFHWCFCGAISFWIIVAIYIFSFFSCHTFNSKQQQKTLHKFVGMFVIVQEKRTCDPMDGHY